MAVDHKIRSIGGVGNRHMVEVVLLEPLEIFSAAAHVQ